MDEQLRETLPSGGFTVRDGLRQGLSPWMLRGDAFAKPFVGVRSSDDPTTVLGRAKAYAPLLRSWQALSGCSALSMLGLPLPWRLRHTETVDVVSIAGRGHPQRTGVRTRRVADDRFDVLETEGVRVASAPLTWALLGASCTVHELVMIGDAIVSDADNYPNRRLAGPLATIDELGRITERWSGSKGAAALRAALPRIRTRVESPRETDMRLFIVDAGMPEPEVQVTILDPQTKRPLGRADLLHREARVVEEYEGDGHRSEQQWDRDIEKYRAFERIGLHVVRATNRDFVPSPEPWLADLAAILRHRSP